MNCATIYLFQSSESRYALSVDKTGCNVPRLQRPWLLRGELKPDELPPEWHAAFESLANYGFSILKVQSD